MIEDDVIQRVLDALTKTPQTTIILAPKLNMDRHTLAFVLACLKRKGKAKRLDVCVKVAYSCYSTKSAWVKT